MLLPLAKRGAPLVGPGGEKAVGPPNPTPPTPPRPPYPGRFPHSRVPVSCSGAMQPLLIIDAKSTQCRRAPPATPPGPPLPPPRLCSVTAPSSRGLILPGPGCLPTGMLRVAADPLLHPEGQSCFAFGVPAPLGGGPPPPQGPPWWGERCGGPHPCAPLTWALPPPGLLRENPSQLPSSHGLILAPCGGGSFCQGKKKALRGQWGNLVATWVLLAIKENVPWPLGFHGAPQGAGCDRGAE